jgi:hypothetical protein
MGKPVSSSGGLWTVESQRGLGCGPGLVVGDRWSVVGAVANLQRRVHLTKVTKVHVM